MFLKTKLNHIMDKEEKCFLCERINRGYFKNLNNLDIDKITFLEKLKLCFRNEIILQATMRICWICVKHLRIAYNLHEIILKSQARLKDNNKINHVERPMVKKDTELNNHSVEKNVIECELCSKQFTRTWQLKRHIEIAHNDMRNYTCSMCGKRFRLASHCKEHEETHLGEQNHECETCGKKFSRLSSKRRHAKVHSIPLGLRTKRTPSTCQICGKSFPFSTGLLRHMKTHLGVKPYGCNICSKKFTQNSHLRSHLMIHTGESPFQCKICKTSFRAKASLNKHLTNHPCQVNNNVN